MPQRPREDWQTVSYTVIPAKSGDMGFSLQGQWAKNADDRGWILIDNVKINVRSFFMMRSFLFIPPELRRL